MTVPSTKQAIERVTNIGELFTALAVGWQEGGYDNRLLIAGDGGQFVRVEPRRYLHTYYKPWPGDIPVESGGYRMRGFIQFEIRSDFRELFTTEHSGDDTWYSAALTAKGAELARAGVLDFIGLEHPFFHPPVTDIGNDPVLGVVLRRIK